PDPAGVADAWERIITALEGIGAAVESPRPGIAWFEERGLRGLHGGTVESVITTTRPALGTPPHPPSTKPQPPPHTPAPQGTTKDPQSNPTHNVTYLHRPNANAGEPNGTPSSSAHSETPGDISHLGSQGGAGRGAPGGASPASGLGGAHATSGASPG